MEDERDVENGVLVVRSDSPAGKEEVNRLVSEEGLSNMGEWQEYTLLYKSIAGPISVLSLEDEAQVLTLPPSADGDFEADTDISDDGCFRGKQSLQESFTKPNVFFLDRNWSNLDAGVKRVMVSAEVTLSETVETSSCFPSKDGVVGEPKQARKVRFELDKVTFQVENAASREEGTCGCVVYQVDIEVMPAASWGSEEHCFDVEAWPDASDARNEVGVQESRGATEEITAGNTGASVKVGSTASRTVSSTRPLHAWESCVNRPTRSATWRWAIKLFDSGHAFKTSKLQKSPFRPGNCAEFMRQMLPPPLRDNNSVQLTNTSCTGVWVVNAAALRGKELPFTVNFTLLTAVVRHIPLTDGVRQFFSFSPRPLRCFGLKHSVKIPFKLAL